MMQERLTGMQSLLLGRPLLVIVFAVSLFISTESAFTAENESIDQATRNLLESLIATHENVLDASRVVSYDFASQYISSGKKIVVSGVADTNQARFRIDYRSTTTVDGTGASKDSGTCLKTPTELIDYHPELKVAYISSDPIRNEIEISSCASYRKTAGFRTTCNFRCPKFYQETAYGTSRDVVYRSIDEMTRSMCKSHLKVAAASSS